VRRPPPQQFLDGLDYDIGNVSDAIAGVMPRFSNATTSINTMVTLSPPVVSNMTTQLNATSYPNATVVDAAVTNTVNGQSLQNLINGDMDGSQVRDCVVGAIRSSLHLRRSVFCIMFLRLAFDLFFLSCLSRAAGECQPQRASGVPLQRYSAAAGPAEPSHHRGVAAAALRTLRGIS
jgi:hypothetical protein